MKSHSLDLDLDHTMVVFHTGDEQFYKNLGVPPWETIRGTADLACKLTLDLASSTICIYTHGVFHGVFHGFPHENLPVEAVLSMSWVETGMGLDLGGWRWWSSPVIDVERELEL